MNTEKASRDVRQKVDEAKPELPDDANTPSVAEINLSLAADNSGGCFRRCARTHPGSPRQGIAGCHRAHSLGSFGRTAGQRDEVLEIIVNKQKLEAYGLAPADIYNIVSRNNLLVAAGSSERDNGRFSVKVPGLVQSPTDLLNLPIKTFEGTVVVLQDVAEVRRTFQDRDRYALYNGRPAITIEVVKRQGTNIIETNDEVKACPRSC